MADAPKGKGLALLLLGGKPGKADKEKADEPESKGDEANEARKAAADSVLAAVQENDAGALDEALDAWLSARS